MSSAQQPYVVPSPAPLTSVTAQATEQRATPLIRTMLLITILVAAALRFYSIDFGLPQMYHPDEPTEILISQRMFKTGDLNPGYFNKPTLVMYLNAAAYVPYYEIGRLLGEFESVDDLTTPQMLGLGTGVTQTPGVVILARSLTALVGTLTVGLTYVVGKRLQGPVTGLLAAVMLTPSTIHVLESHYLTTNVYLTFFALLTGWAALNIYQRGRWRDYLLAGIATGLVISTKYNGGTIFLMVAVAHFLRSGWRGVKQPQLYIAALLAPLAFLLTSPYTLLEFETFWRDMTFEAAHYAAGHDGMEGNAFRWYLSHFWQVTGPVLPLAVVATAVAIYRRAWHVVTLAVFPWTYILFISTFAVRNGRTALPATPFLFLLVAWLLLEAWAWLAQRRGTSVHRFGRYAIILVLLGILVWPIGNTARALDRLQRTDSRETARAWIDANLPENKKIGIEAYSPYVDPDRFAVEALNRADQDAAWYAENGFDYLILSEGMFQRYFNDPERYSAQIAHYTELFDSLNLVKQFNDGDFEIRIYAVPP